MKLDSQLPGDSFKVELTGIAMRMRQQAREIVSNVFLSEEETRALLSSEIDRAVRSIDWAKIVGDELRSQVSVAVRGLVEDWSRSLLWDEQIRSTLRARLVERLSKPEEDR
jgi:hypothetical protein